MCALCVQDIALANLTTERYVPVCSCSAFIGAPYYYYYYYYYYDDDDGDDDGDGDNDCCCCCCCYCCYYYYCLLTYAHRSWWSIGHLRPLSIALCSGLLWPFQTSWSLAVSALLQCLASNCCEAGLSFSSPAGSRSGLGVWCWMLAS